MHINIEKSISTINDKQVDRYIISNNNNVSVSILNYGGIISSFKTQDKNDNLSNIILGFDDVNKYASEEYLKNNSCFGAITGRFACRINNAPLDTENKNISLTESGENKHFYIGNLGFDKVFWDVKVIENQDNISLLLTYSSKYLEENSPINLNVSVLYTLYEKNMFSITYKANTSKPTILNLSNNFYINLDGTEKDSDILDTQIQVNSEKYFSLSNNSTPAFEKADLKDTKYDLTNLTTFKNVLDKLPDGIDTSFFLKDKKYLKNACNLWNKKTGRRLKVFTTYPILHVYTGNNIPKTEKISDKNSGVALIPQNFPNVPEKYNFQSTYLKPKQNYRNNTIYIF
ncbi:MAG: hypothetical protein ACOX4D_08275 [Bacteroidales bacterium]|jgi:aldose 1-epimerase